MSSGWKQMIFGKSVKQILAIARLLKMVVFDFCEGNTLVIEVSLSGQTMACSFLMSNVHLGSLQTSAEKVLKIELEVS